jgi:peptidoglycan hydrolase-like protein with peptidoglycan-binding domain
VSRRGARATVLGLAAALAAGAALIVIDPFGGSGRADAGVLDNASATSLASVKRQRLSSQRSEVGTLAFAGEYTVVNQAGGTLTALPSVGQVVESGAVLYQVATKPVLLLYGHTPAYRALSQGMRGRDVRELNTDLVALGYAPREQLEPSSEYFGAATSYALRRLQDKLGLEETGRLALGQAVFAPAPLRITKLSATLGAQVPPGGTVALASSTVRQVVVKLDAAGQAGVRKGDRVTITLPDNRTTPGVVSSVGAVATSESEKGGEESAPTIEVDIAPTHPAVTGRLDKAPVKVSITTSTVPDALVVPVNALLALAGGGYAVEEVAGTAHRLVPVTLGLFDDAEGLVQVHGSGLAAGQQVVVPST